eukprot:TRINITY_DN31440_c0_g1_i1.p1 TRINITY_DN31440_c0_g1~~TRINITY_DN31440_c0_g1_i1.p1  ORF type:complete len:325 (-),score=69.97 TRINITY_DN31440_c0_g1_i1:8-982(-)
MEPLSIEIKWKSMSFMVVCDLCMSLLDLKNKIFQVTNVLPEKQKLIGLKYKGGNPGDTVLVSELGLKPAQKVMMMGTPEADALPPPPPPSDEADNEVVNDLDFDYREMLAVHEHPDNQRKLANRIATYKIEVKHAPRPGKKLLVLDIDYTLFDHRSVAERPLELMRPFLHEFLTEAYNDYDIVLWSATSMKWIDLKMQELGVYANPNYRISFALCHNAMFSVSSEKYGVHDVKPLQVIWSKFPEFYSPHNTIMFDDLSRNFAMNPKSGLKIRPFRSCHINRASDRELLLLSNYLKLIAPLPIFEELDHSDWERFVERYEKMTRS